MSRSFTRAGFLFMALALSGAALAQGGGNGGQGGDRGGGGAGGAGGGQSPFGIVDIRNEDADQMALAAAVKERKRKGNCRVAACAPPNQPPPRLSRLQPTTIEPCGQDVIRIHRNAFGEVIRYTCEKL